MFLRVKLYADPECEIKKGVNGVSLKIEKTVKKLRKNFIINIF